MSTKLRLVFSITMLFLSFYGFAQDSYWKQEITPKPGEKLYKERFNIQKAKVFSIKETLFKNELKTVSASKNNTKIVYFPDELGDLVPFEIAEASVLSPELAAKYPYIKSYVGYGLGTNKDKIRLSVSQNGVQSMIVHADHKENTFMQKTPDGTYIVYKRDADATSDKDFICNTTTVLEKAQGTTLKLVDDQQLRKFRLAVSASGEYTDYHGGTVADALAAINATVTRINEVFETDLGITLELVANNDNIIFTDATNDPYTSSLNSETQNTLNDVIGAANYDIGHLFHVSTTGDGNAGFIGTVCVDTRKGGAYASGPDPVGDTFDLDFVAHEMGHQLGANHTWSFESEGTQVQVEPGSGTTIMGYAGITGVNNVAPNGDDYFHYSSIVQITDYLGTVSCGETMSLTNAPPVIMPTGDFIIPKSTAFVLAASATDTDAADVLTYAWEQVDDGVITQATFGPTNLSGANFRSQRPSVDPERYFPQLSRVVQGNLTQTTPPINSAWETVSDIEREMNFALTVRDNAIGGGQVSSDLVNISVVDGSGPFVVTSQSSNVTTVAGEVIEITWDVANTNKALVNAQTVDIMLSTDGGLTFPVSLANDVPNDGTHPIVIPGNATTMARIMVKAHDNIFFAVNGSNFTITDSEIVLNFENLEYQVCQSDDLVVPFNYETYLGFSEEAIFSVVAPPTGLTASFSPTSATTDDTPVAVTFSGTENLAVGNYPITVLATAASRTKQLTFDLNVYNANFSAVTLLTPVDGATNTTVRIPLEWEANIAYTSYDIEIATDAAFITIVDAVSVNTNSYEPLNLAYETQYFWRIKPKNNCGEGVFGTPFSFTTAQFNCTTKIAVGLPLEIASTGTPTITSTIAFFEDLPVVDVNLSLDLDHEFLADLTVSLTSPSGTTVVLVSNSCGQLRNIDATFDDDGSNFICSGTPAISGTVRPLGSLDSFFGESILGEWTLSVADGANSDGGSLNAFNLEVCVEGQFRPDADQDGVFDDGPDLCLGTPIGAEVDADGCPIFRFPDDNFTITAMNDSCNAVNSGIIEIDAVLALDYTVSVSGNGVNVTDTFTDTYQLSNLAVGTYTVCITGTDGTIDYEESCFDITVSEPQPLSVSSRVSTDLTQVVLTLGGSESYNIELNGELVRSVDPEITLDLTQLTNTLRVTTGLSCQGVYEEQIVVSDKPIIYPNPFTESVSLIFRGDVEQVMIAIFTSDGRLIQQNNYVIPLNVPEVTLDLSALATGVYHIKYESATLKGASTIVKR